MKAYIKAIEYYLPEITEENTNARLRKKTGIERRHICPPNMTAGDMAAIAAEKLFEHGLDRSSIDFLLLCTQSPDYYLPTTACILQDRLKLSKNCGALDFNLGCSGFIYGLGLAKGLIESGQCRNVLLLTSETYSKYINPEDNSTKNLFGDAASAVLVSAVDTDKSGLYGFVYGTDGSGAGDLIVPVGGSRNSYMNTETETFRDSYGNVRRNRDLYMNGQNIMNFALDTVPSTVNKILADSSLGRQDINYYIFHQANNLILDSLRDKCGLQEMPYWEDIKEYGNTVSSSLPIAAEDMLSLKHYSSARRVMMIGFGVGLSWGGCIADMSFIAGRKFSERDKTKEYLRIEGDSVILEEIRPEYFPCVINWRNDGELNRFINQPYELTYESESQWYENIYLRDNTQGFMIMIDKESMKPFATLGWTDFDCEKKQCILGRLMLSDSGYASALMEGNILLSDYLYEFVDVMYAHVGIHNRKALRWDFMMGFEKHSGEWEYPSEALVNNVEQCEIFRTAEKHYETRKLLTTAKIKSVEYMMTENKTVSTIETRNTKHETRNTKHETRNTNNLCFNKSIIYRQIIPCSYLLGREFLHASSLEAA